MLAIYLAVGALAADCTGGAANNCAQGKCEMIGEIEVCTECTVNGGKGYVPINGICKAHDDATTTVAAGAGCLKEGDVAADATSTTCKKCSGANYFLFMGGCYKTGETPGTLICSAAAAGKCSTCIEGGNVFKNQATGPTLGTECILCSDSKGSNDNKGALNCVTCTAPTAATGTAACTKCDQTKYLKEGVCVDSTECIGATFPKANTGAGNRCVPCGDEAAGVADCKTCTAPSGGKTKLVCSECSNFFLHTPAGGETSCEEACPEGYFGHTATTTNRKTCQSCSTASGLNPSVTGIEGCTSCTYTSSTLKCTACGEGKKPNKEGIGCFDCGISGCTYCSGAGKCEECGSGFSLEGEACISTGGVNLSAGAIAGISVAAVVVVGGLGSFLCWWFVCRTKR
ncbi:Serine/threonine protein kinase/ Variant-specific surface protein [Giardia duodenalis assemblage B]|uniref:Serine/threonine protein kinase/ Variant-specific surface protein n=1 Tax=Giardia duodenalis assemblage B TaxID=1394984 RepID=A0A132NMB1_GIAIN|nr:Serine/threonine protein kinase/ Variant-specific surface protein [Giardia intestinalis assemblage B]